MPLSRRACVGTECWLLLCRNCNTTPELRTIILIILCVDCLETLDASGRKNSGRISVDLFSLDVYIDRVSTNPHERPGDRMPECGKCPAFIWTPESLATGKCAGCRSTTTPKVIPVPDEMAARMDKLRRGILNNFLNLNDFVRHHRHEIAWDGEMRSPEEVTFYLRLQGDATLFLRESASDFSIEIRCARKA